MQAKVSLRNPLDTILSTAGEIGSTGYTSPTTPVSHTPKAHTQSYLVKKCGIFLRSILAATTIWAHC
ncbi:MAG: hypothetical protein IPG02_02800 [Ignavibacteria bacterium]|nr:hypothetical protein [Ignavibacteria bacterium]